MLVFIQESLGTATNSFSSSDSLKDAGIDSFKIIELILFLENKFGLHFPEDAYTIENLKSIDSIFNAVTGD